MTAARPAMWIVAAAIVSAIPRAGNAVVMASGAQGGAGEEERMEQRHLRAHMVPGWGGPTWGGRSFSDSFANFNPWAKKKAVPAVVQNLDPVAPLDRTDQTWGDPLTGAAPQAPTDETGNSAFSPALQSDYVAPDMNPHTFPADEDRPPERSAYGQTPLADKNLIASADKLRPPNGWRSNGNYPLVAPADRIISSKQKTRALFGLPVDPHPWPVGSSDYVDEVFARYFEQVHNREQQRQANARLAEAYGAADKDKDGTVSRAEYDQLLMDGQNKTREESERMWSRYHLSEGAGLSKDDFQRLASSGFDLGAIPRDDISSVISIPGSPHKGFWGSGAKCPHGSYVKGAKLKIQPLAPRQDDTALNAVGLKCSDGTEINTVEGPHGGWTEWALCPAGQWVFSVRARGHPYKKGQDNAGLASLELGCRRPDLGGMAKLRFVSESVKSALPANENVVMSAGPVAKGGGWTKEFMCGPSSAFCGAQAHVIRDQGGVDDMGVADLRLYCCAVPVDCSGACAPPQGSGSVKCQVCHLAAGTKKSSGHSTNAGVGGGQEYPGQEDFQAGRRRRSVVLPTSPWESGPESLLPSEILPLSTGR